MVAFLFFFFILIPFLIAASIASPAFGFALVVMIVCYIGLWKFAHINSPKGK